MNGAAEDSEIARTARSIFPAAVNEQNGYNSVVFVLLPFRPDDILRRLDLAPLEGLAHVVEFHERDRNVHWLIVEYGFHNLYRANCHHPPPAPAFPLPNSPLCSS